MYNEIELLKGFVFNTVPTVYQEGMSYYEVLLRVIAKLNELIKVSNDYFSVSVKDNLIEILHTWQEDGTLDIVISEALQTQIDDVEAKVDNVIYMQEFPKLIGETDDTLRLQRALNYAGNPLNKRNTLDLGGKDYYFTGVTIPRDIILQGKAELFLTGEGSIGLKLYNTLHTTIKDVKITLTDKDQTAIHIESVEGAESQLNNFYSVYVEGHLLENSLALKIGHAWVNSFYGCKLFRTVNGVIFDDNASNANMFYGCELRQSGSAAPFNGTAIIHRGGLSNSFIGGVIENYEYLVEMIGGSLVFNSAYTEAFLAGRPAIIKGGNISFINCLVKFYVQIEGGVSVTFRDCDMTKMPDKTNYSYPFIVFRNDVSTIVNMVNNTIPDTLFHARYEMFQSVDGGTFAKRTTPVKEYYKDRQIPYIGSLVASTLSTGDNSDVSLQFPQDANNIYNEIKTNGFFKPIDTGLYKFSIILIIDGVTDPDSLVALRLTERGATARSFTLIEQTAVNKTTTNRMTLTGEITLIPQHDMFVNFQLQVSGSEKTVSVIKSYYTIERLA